MITAISSGKGVHAAATSERTLLLARNKIYTTFKLPKGFDALRWAPNSDTLLAGRTKRGEIMLCTIEWQGNIAQKLSGHKLVSSGCGAGTPFTWSSDGRLLADVGSILVIFTNRGEVEQKLSRAEDKRTALAWKGERMAYGTSKGLVRIDGGGRTESWEFQSAITQLEWSPDRDLLAALTAKGKLHILRPGPGKVADLDPVSAFSWGAGGRLATADGTTMRIVDDAEALFSDGAGSHWGTSDSPVTCVCWDGSDVLMGTQSGKVTRGRTV